MSKPQNLPSKLSSREHPEFLITEWQKKGNDYLFNYLVDERGISVYFNNKIKFEQFPHFFEVVSGGWYGDTGRWSPVERFMGTIECEGVSSFKKISTIGKNYKFQVSKGFFSSNKTVLIESNPVGIIKLKCKKIIPQTFKTYLFHKPSNKWIERTDAIDMLKSLIN